MPALLLDQVEIYVFRRRHGRVEFLALKRSEAAALPGVWQPITGRLRRGESALGAARREVREETGFVPKRWWSLEAPTIYFDARSDAVVALPLFAAEVGAAEAVILSKEHGEARFVSARQAGKLYLWNAQRRGLEAVRRQVLDAGPLARALAIAVPRAQRPRHVARGRDPRRRT